MQIKNKKSFLLQRTGAGRFGGFFSMVFILLILLGALSFGSPYYENWKLGGMLRSIATQSTIMTNNAEIAVYAASELAKQGYTFKANEIKVERNGNTIEFTIDYKVDIYLAGSKVLLTTLTFNKQGGNTKTTK